MSRHSASSSSAPFSAYRTTLMPAGGLRSCGIAYSIDSCQLQTATQSGTHPPARTGKRSHVLPAPSAVSASAAHKSRRSCVLFTVLGTLLLSVCVAAVVYFILQHQRTATTHTTNTPITPNPNDVNSRMIATALNFDSTAAAAAAASQQPQQPPPSIPTPVNPPPTSATTTDINDDKTNTMNSEQTAQEQQQPPLPAQPQQPQPLPQQHPLIKKITQQHNRLKSARYSPVA